MKLGGKNKHKSKIHDWHNQTGSALFGGGGGLRGGQYRKIITNEVFPNMRYFLMEFDI